MICSENQKRIEELDQQIIGWDRFTENRKLEENTSFVKGVRKGLEEGALNQNKWFLEWLNTFNSSDDGWRKIQDKIKELEAQA